MSVIEMDEEIKKAVKDVVENPSKYPNEARMILTIETWYRQGPSFTDEQGYEVIQGDVKEVELESFDEGYPYRKGHKVAIIPLTIPTIIDLHSYSDTTDPPIKRRTLYIFTVEGWKSVRVY